MKLKEILIIVPFIVLNSACSSKDEFNRGMYNYIQNDTFCLDRKECEKKRLHKNHFIKKETIPYDEYKKSLY
jgi:hypothetical protein